MENKVIGQCVKEMADFFETRVKKVIYQKNLAAAKKSKEKEILKKSQQTLTLVTYAEIGACFNNSRFGLLLWRNCFC